MLNDHSAVVCGFKLERKQHQEKVFLAVDTCHVWGVCLTDFLMGFRLR